MPNLYPFCQKCGGHTEALGYLGTSASLEWDSSKQLGELYKLYSEEERQSEELSNLAENVPRFDRISAFYYEAIYREQGKVEFGVWNHYFSKILDSSMFSFCQHNLEEIYARGKAFFFGATLISEKISQFNNWNPKLLSYLDENERKIISPFANQIYREVMDLKKGDASVHSNKFGLNTKQRIFIFVGLILMLLMLLYPPWSTRDGLPREYGFIFFPPKRAYVIDTIRLFIQCIIVALLTSGIVFALKIKK